MLAAMALTATTANAQDLKLVSQEYYGNAMTGGNSKSGELKYFYDSTGRLVATYETKGNSPFARTEYEYNAQGHRTSETHYQYGLYDNGQDGWSDGETITYPLDANGNIAAVKHSYELPWGGTYTYNEFEYTYDKDGNLLTETYYFSQRGASPEKQWTATYTYNAAGKPTKKVVDSVWDSECLTVTYTYDENGNILEELETYTKPEAVGDKEFGNKIVYTYNEDGVITTRTKYEYKQNADYVFDFYATQQTRYSIVQGNKNVIEHSDYTRDAYLDPDTQEWIEGNWVMSLGSRTIDKYVDFEGMAEYMACELTAEVSDANTNTVKLTASIPEGAQFGTVRYDVYRNAQLVSSHLLSDLAAEGYIENNMVNIYDAKLKNGSYKYFIQIVMPANNDDVEETSVEWIGYNVSNVATVDVENQNLPKATNVRLASSSQTEDKDSDGNPVSIGSAVVAYDFPAQVDPALGFQGNYLFINTVGVYRQLPDDSTTQPGNGQLTATLLAGNEIGAYIQSRYTYGKVESERVTLKLDEATAIENVQSEMKSEGVKVYDLQGRQVSNIVKGNAYVILNGNTVRTVIIK